MNSDAFHDPRLQKLSELLKGIEYAMLTTREADGTLHSRPMRTETLQHDGTLVFFTQQNSAKARELEANPQVSLSYMGPGAATCVCIAGRARLRQDSAKMNALWNPLYKVWFPKGLEDPDLTLLEVTIDRAEYWQTPSNVVTRVFGAAQALAKGEPIADQVGSHERMTLRGS